MISPSALAIVLARPRGAGEDDVAHAVAASGHSEALCENPTCCLGHAVVNVLVPESANPYEVHAPWYTVPTRCPCHLLVDTAGKRRAAADPSFVLRVCNATPFASLGAGASAAASSDNVNAGCVQGAGCMGAHFVDHPAAESIARTISQLRSSFMTVRSLEARFNAIAPSIASSVLLRTAIPALNEPSVAAQLASSAEPRAAAAPMPTSITIPPAPVVVAKPIMSPLPPKPVEPSLAQQLEAEREKLRQAQATLETERRQLADHRKRLDEDRARFEAEKAARAGAGSYVCAICCTSKPRQEGCQCSVCQATVCGECLSSYLLENWTKSENFALNLTATELPSVPCVQCEGQGFDSIAVLETVNRNARRFYLNVARRLSEARGFGEAHVVLEQVLVDLVDRGVLHKMPAVPTKLLDEQFKRQLLNSYMCPRCHFGPITTAGCDDLRRHHEEQVGGAQYDNSCPGCGYLPEVLSDLLVWDGVVRDGRTTRTDSDGGDLPPPVARQVGAHGLSRRILEQFLDMGFSEEVIEEAASQIDDPNNAALLLATLVPE